MTSSQQAAVESFTWLKGQAIAIGERMDEARTKLAIEGESKEITATVDKLDREFSEIESRVFFEHKNLWQLGLVKRPHRLAES